MHTNCKPILARVQGMYGYCFLEQIETLIFLDEQLERMLFDLDEELLDNFAKLAVDQDTTGHLTLLQGVGLQ